MDIEDGSPENPLQLSLDDIIKLNSYRNRAKTNDENHQETKQNGHIKIESPDLSQIMDASPPRAGIKSRLGWKNNWKRSETQSQALRLVRNAQYLKAANTRKRFKTNNNGSMPPPLTTKVIRQHNRVNGDFTIRRRIGAAASVRSMNTQSSVGGFTRHSLKKCLNPSIMEVLEQLMTSSNVSKVRSSSGRPLQFSFTCLNDYKACPVGTSMPTYIRFKLSDLD